MEILSTTLPYVDGVSIIFGCIFVILGLLCAVCMFISFKENEAGLSISFLFFTALFTLFTYVAWFVPDKPYTTHEVRITDMSKFDTTKYQIVEQRGKIFVVKELTKGER